MNKRKIEIKCPVCGKLCRNVNAHIEAKHEEINRKKFLEFGKQILIQDKDSVIVPEIKSNEGIKVSNKPLPKQEWRTDICDDRHYD